MSLYKMPPSIHDQLREFNEKYHRIFDKRVTKREKLAIIVTEGFQIGLVTYLILLLLETLKEGFVSYFFNMNYLLAFVLVSGIVMALTTEVTEDAREPRHEKLSFWNWFYIIMMSIGGGALIYYKTAELAGLSLFISGITVLIIFLLSILIYTHNGDASE